MNHWMIGLALWVTPAMLLGIIMLAVVIRSPKRHRGVEDGLEEHKEGEHPAGDADSPNGDIPTAMATPESVKVGANSH